MKRCNEINSISSPRTEYPDDDEVNVERNLKLSLNACCCCGVVTPLLSVHQLFWFDIQPGCMVLKRICSLISVDPS